MPTIDFRSTRPVPEIATKSDLCPMCDVRIEKGRTQVMKLYRPLKPRYEVQEKHRGKNFNGEFCVWKAWVSKDTGKPYNPEDPYRPIRTRGRWYVHERCYPAAEKALDRGDD